MPYPNEHACRLQDPGKYDRFARKNCEQKHEGKCIDVIYGVKSDGKAEIQALRYPKKVWTEAAAKSHCASRNGSFEAAGESRAIDATAGRTEPEFKIYEFKQAELREDGCFRAVFATLDVVDAQGDVTISGAFGEQSIIVSQYNHGSWDHGADALPIGVGKIHEEGKEAIVEGEFDMADDAAVRTYKKIKYLHEKGRRQEWSYALPEVDYEFREQDGRRVRVLKRIRVNEVSPVLMGAGVNTRLLAIKGGAPRGHRLIEQVAALRDGAEDVLGRLAVIKDMRALEDRDISEATAEEVGVLAHALTEAAAGLKRLLESAPDVDEIAREALRFQRIVAERRP